jgi:putative FmdB family regulatory protein
MPLYEYKCSSCSYAVEMVQKVNDKPPKKCPKCGCSLTKVISAPALQFKGNGWYITDYPRKHSPSKDEPPEEKKDSPKKEAKPKEKPPSD